VWKLTLAIVILAALLALIIVYWPGRPLAPEAPMAPLVTPTPTERVWYGER
jgi:hypothetical protein